MSLNLCVRCAWLKTCNLTRCDTSSKTRIHGIRGGLPLMFGRNPNPTQKPGAGGLQPEPGMPTPIFRRSTPAVNYLYLGGPTKISFEGAPLVSAGHGAARVESERGVIRVSGEFENLFCRSFGPKYLTYVLGAISPDGRPINLGELTLNHYGNSSKSEIKTTSEIQTFGGQPAERRSGHRKRGAQGHTRRDRNDRRQVRHRVPRLSFS
jgi:hypothetical protein